MPAGAPSTARPTVGRPATLIPCDYGLVGAVEYSTCALTCSLQVFFIAAFDMLLSAAFCLTMQSFINWCLLVIGEAGVAAGVVLTGVVAEGMAVEGVAASSA
jgi:hypothetical protein